MDFGRRSGHEEETSAQRNIDGSRLTSRRKFMKGAVAVAGTAASLNFIPLARAAVSPPVIETANGKLRGEARNGVNAFLGIRYGESTGGANRFLPPVPVTPWAGVRDATSFGASAPQNPESLGAMERWYTEIQPISEDCLFLNVFAPERDAHAKRPVMVWLHGGGWSSCAGTAPGFDGTRLARDGDVVAVTVNHRLNVFGYLYFGEDDPRFSRAGNAGMLDLVAALRWVRDNIAAFGGDPGNVTIFGQSGGSAKVASLMAMPAAHGLFHKAVIESCSGGMALDQPDEAARQAHALAARLGIPAFDGKALQALPMQTLLGAMKTVKTPFRPVLDHHNFVRDPFTPDPSPLAATVPLLIGNAATETTLYLSIDPKNLKLTADDVHRRLSKLLKIDDRQTSRIEDVYRATMNDPTPSDVLAAVTTDYVFRRNTTLLAARDSSQAPVYTYVFDWKTPVMDGLLHSPHTIEVPFVFGNIREASGLIGTGPELPQLSRDVMNAWVAFARTGNPDCQYLPRWPRYNVTTKETMMLDTQSHVERDPGGDARQALSDIPLYEYDVNRRAMLHG